MPKVKYPIFKFMHRGEKGFTLIELLIVVAILGIIAAVVIPNIAGFMVTGTLAAANTEAENMKTGSLAYFAEYGVWPDTSGNLTPAYISGAPKAEYTFDMDYGWITDATPDPVTGWAGIEWTGAVIGPTGQHGSWTRL